MIWFRHELFWHVNDAFAITHMVLCQPFGNTDTELSEDLLSNLLPLFSSFSVGMVWLISTEVGIKLSSFVQWTNSCEATFNYFIKRKAFAAAFVAFQANQYRLRLFVPLYCRLRSPMDNNKSHNMHNMSIAPSAKSYSSYLFVWLVKRDLLISYKKPHGRFYGASKLISLSSCMQVVCWKCNRLRSPSNYYIGFQFEAG